MARYPTFDEYRAKPAKGIQRCDELLKRDPDNVAITLTKLQFQTIQGDVQAANSTLEKLYTSKQPITDLSDISTIEEAVVELQALTSYPPPVSAGPGVAKLWDSAYKTSNNNRFKLDLQSLRCTRAIIDNRHADAQQALIQLKGLMPKNRSFYMAHAAITQILSGDKDDLQSRLALSLARKAVNDKFDEDKDLDCRVPGQIFALQAAQTDVDSIIDRKFADSKQVFDYRRKVNPPVSHNAASEQAADPADISPKEWLSTEVSKLKSQCANIVKQNDQQHLQAFADNAVRLFVTATESLHLRSYRLVSEAIFLAISALIKLWALTQDPTPLLQSVYLADSLLLLQPKVHEARVILVYLYMRLGLGRSGYQEWDNLSTKEIQYDTFGHSFLFQISIVHPHYLGDIDPERIIAHGLSIYRRWEDKTAQTHASVLQHGQTGMMFDLYELRECLRLSVTRKVLSLEYRRLARVHNKPMDSDHLDLSRLTDAWFDAKDNRDFATAFDYGLNVERALHGQDRVEYYVLLGLATDAVWCLATNQTALIKDSDKLLAKLETTDLDAAPEYQQVAMQLLLLLLRSLVGPSSRITKEQIVAAVGSFCIDELVAEQTVLPDHIRSTYLYLETMLVVSTYAKHAESKKLLTKNDANAVRDRAHQEIKRLQVYCNERIAATGSKDIRAMLQPTAQAGVLRYLHHSTDDIDRFCDKIAAATKDAWNGASMYKC